MTGAHSYWSASRFEQRMLCPGSSVLEEGEPDNTSAYAAEGTAAHQVLTWALQEAQDASHYVGLYIYLDKAGRVQVNELDHVYGFLVDRDMADHVQVCIDYVREVAGDNPIIADTRVNYAGYLDVPEDDAWGTSDVIILLPDEIVVVDFKYGMGVQVGAGYDDQSENGIVLRAYHPNPQMALYGLGALADYRDFTDFTRARLVISQPRITTKPSEYDLPIEALERWGTADARSAVQSCQRAADTFATIDRRTWEDGYLRPGEKQCKFCKAKATCPALRREVSLTVLGTDAASPQEFDTAPPVTVDAVVETALITGETDEVPHWLAACLSKVDLIEDWCKAIRAAVEGRLLAGNPVPGYKLVQGKRGNRAWKSAEMAEQALKSMRLKAEDMYDFKLISPTSADKLVKAKVIGPRQWPKLQELIHQPEGRAHVAPLSDPRPALVVGPVSDDFTDVTHPPAELGWNR